MEKFKLSKNDYLVLKDLTKDSSVTDLEISKKIGITPSAVARIKQKLKKKGIIKSYCININYDILGIKCYVMVFYDASPLWWQKLNDDKVLKITTVPQIITAIRTNEKDYSYIVIYGFTDNKSANEYFNEVQRVYNNYLKIQNTIFLSNNNFIKNYPHGLLDISYKNEKTVPNEKLFEILKK